MRLNQAKFAWFPLLGDGSNRAVLNIEGYAVKIPIEVYGLKQNEKELYFWN